MPEVEGESITIHTIIDGTADNGGWHAFRAALAMSTSRYPNTIRETEGVMTGYEASLPDNR